MFTGITAAAGMSLNIPLFAVIVVIYMLAISYLGWRGWKATKTAADYLVAGRDVHPYIMAMSYGATFISTSAIVGFGGVAGLFGLSLLWLTFCNIAVGIFIAFVFLGKRTRQVSHHLSAHTFPEMLGKRYKSKFIQVSTAFIILTMVLYAAAVLIGAARHLEGIIGLSIDLAILLFVVFTTAYVVAGGLKGVMYTDALQGSLMFIGMALLLIMTLTNPKIDGLTNAHKKMDIAYQKVLTPAHLKSGIAIAGKNLPDSIALDDKSVDEYFAKTMAAVKAGKGIPGIMGGIAKIELENVKLTIAAKKELFQRVKPYVLQFLVLNGIKKGGHQGWTKMPAAGTPIWFTVISTLTLGVGIGVLAQPQLSVRFMTVKSSREINRSVLIGGVFIILMTGIAFVVGSVSNAYFFEHHQGLTAIGIAGGNADAVIPAFLKSAMPPWFNYIFLIALVSAAMSTMSSQFHTMGTAISRDIFEALGFIKKEEQGGKKSIIAAKLGVGVMIILTVIIAYILPGSIIATATAIFMGLCAAAFLPSLVGGLYWRGATKAGAIASICTGTATSLFWLIFVHADTVKKLGKTSILEGSTWSLADPILIALPISIVIFIVVSLFTKKMEQEHLEVCFRK